MVKNSVVLLQQLYVKSYGRDIKLQDLFVEDGRDYMRSLMERTKRYKDHPMRTEDDGKLKVQFIQELGCAVRSFSTWANEEG